MGEGDTAYYYAAYGLLALPTDETTLAVAHALVERITLTSDWSQDRLDGVKAVPAYRELEETEEPSVTVLSPPWPGVGGVRSRCQPFC